MLAIGEGGGVLGTVLGGHGRCKVGRGICGGRRGCAVRETSVGVLRLVCVATDSEIEIGGQTGSSEVFIGVVVARGECVRCEIRGWGISLS